jgi:lauroyl/myristoyl acyltransferase
LALNALISLRLVRKPQEAIENVDIAAIRDSYAVQRNQESGAPALAVMSHLGNWELLGLAVSREGFPVSAIAHPIANKGIEERVLRTRQAFGLQVVLSTGGVDGLRRAARDGRILVIIMDQKTHIGRGGAFAEFFGLPVPMTRAPSVLARRLKLPVFAAACVREGDKYRLVVEDITHDASEFASDDELLQKLASANERLIRAYPEQYVWTYRRWRYIPEWADDALAARFPSYARRYSGG